jgi:hypothetical protein
MRRRVIDKAGAIGLPLLGVAVLAALAIATAQAKDGNPRQAVSTSSKGGAFAIRGNVTGLYPGRKKHFPVTVSNRNRFAIRVTSIRVRVGNAAGCSRSNLVVGNFRGSLRVGAQRTRRVWLPITMRRSAPDACMGARLKLTYSGKAVKR